MLFVHLTVILARLIGPGGGTGPSWLTVIGHAKDRLWSRDAGPRDAGPVDLFRCESIRLHTHWILEVTDQSTRWIVGFGVQAGAVDGRALCRMFNRAIFKKGEPRYLRSVNDPPFQYHQWQANLRIIDVEEIKTVRDVPSSHPFIERSIGTIRREFLNHPFFRNATNLLRKLAVFQHYYNTKRVHASFDGQPPEATLEHHVVLGNFRWQPCCR